MKKIAFISFLSFFGICGKAQNITPVGEFKIGAGATLAIPANNLPVVSIGAGLDILAQYGLSENLVATADAGYTALFSKEKNLYGTSNLFPIRLGIRYFLNPDIYLGAKAGAGINSIKNTSISYFAYSVGAGYYLDPKIDVGAVYDGYTKSSNSFGYIGIRLGYTFN